MPSRRPALVCVLRNRTYPVASSILTFSPHAGWQRGLILLVSVPIGFALRVNYVLLRDRAAARRHGAVLPPQKPSAIGGVDILRDALSKAHLEYPGEGLAVFRDALGGGMFNLRILFENRFFTSEPEHIKAMLATQFSSFEKGADSRDFFSDLLGSGIFLADGDLWKFHRAMTRPFFKRDRISDFELFDRHSLAAIEKIKQRLREGYAVDFQDVMTRFAMDASGEFLFGSSMHMLDAGLPYPHTSIANNTPNTHNPAHAASLAVAETLTRAQDKTIRRGGLGFVWPLREFWENEVAPDVKKINAFLNPILQTAIERDGRVGEKLAPGVVVKDREVQEGETLVEHLLHYTQDSLIYAFVLRTADWTPDTAILRDSILNIGIAGRDTTSCLLTFVIYMLTEHPDVLAKLRAEVIEVVGPSRAPTQDDIREMKYLRAVLNETLRLYPPVPLNMRSTTGPVVLQPAIPADKPVYLPANSKVPYATIVMHRRKDLWGEDALTWDPERFIDQRLHKYLLPNPFIFLPFSAGPRICIGQQFAYNETSVFLVRLLQQFSSIGLAMDAQPPQSIPPPEWRNSETDVMGWKRRERLFVKSHLTMYIQGGIWVKMEEAKY
ncbi:hypothetical protein MKEN_01411400 [Mycena kentingensis (nom. inval.)]|nr:hypothetical protein MKEN_01411400 [Mycena kentingensis (nom. inval.)]